MGSGDYGRWGYPEQCAYGHRWRGPGETVIVSWLPCLCVAGQLGHLRARCLGDDGRCPSVFYGPPHTAGAEIRGRD